MDETLAPASETLSANATALASDEEKENMNGDQPMTDAAEDLSNPSSDSESSDSDSDDEDQQNFQLHTLESELSYNPSNYDAHVKYIRLLRKMGEVEKVRKAREAMSALFPLTPNMWQEWAKDETTHNKGTETLSTVENIYERGTSEYLSVSLWADYLNFMQEFDPEVLQCSPAGISKARELFERALIACGLHLMEGNIIWELYIEFEQAILHTIDETNSEEKEKQIQRIRSIFHRQLSVPHVDIKKTLLAYKAWEAEQNKVHDIESLDVDDIPSNVASAYQKALEMNAARIHFEEQISKKDLSGEERLQQYMNYLKFEQSSGTPTRVQVLYERAVTELPISSDLWLDYTSYLDKTLKVGNIVRDVHSRSTRNCPWVGELWVRYLLSLERSHASEEEIVTVFENSLQCTLASVYEYKDLFLTRIDGLRRRISFNKAGEDLLDYRLIRETFQRASDYLSPHLKNTQDMLQLYAYWAHLEVKLARDISGARGVWENLLKISGSVVETWIGYIAMETELGHINEARSLYKRCYSKRFPGTGSEDICYAWLQFERKFGTLEDLDHASLKVTPRLLELQLFRIQQETKPTDERDITVKRNAPQKRKPESDTSEHQSPAKRKKDASQEKKSLGKDKARHHVELTKHEENSARDSEAENLPKQKTAYEKNKGFTDQCTAFVSNLDIKSSSEDIRKFFGDVGGVVAVRVLHDRFTGKSRGLAYVDFSDEEHLAAAVAKNKQNLMGRKLSIARSNPKQGRNKSSGSRFTKENSKWTDFTNPSGTSEDSKSKVSDNTSKVATREPHFTSRKSGIVDLIGKNTFAVPRNVKPLGWTTSEPKSEDQDEQPKSNDEFRKLFLKGK